MDSNGILTPRLMHEYSYDQDNRVIEKTSGFGPASMVTLVDRYLWIGDLISVVETYDSEDELLHEYFYEYDDKRNYKKDNLFFIADPLNWLDHNATKLSIVDHSGLIDVVCLECDIDYSYNQDDYPVEVIYEWGEERITYQ